MRLNIAITLAENDTASSTIEIALQDDTIGWMGLDPADFWAEAESELLYDMPAGATLNSYSEGGWSGFNIAIPAAPLDQMGDLAGVGIDDTTIYRDGDYFVFTAAEIGMAEEVQLEDEYADLFDTASMSLTFDLVCPGPVVSANGTITGNRVHWNLAEISGETALTARCSAIATADAVGDGAAAVEAADSWFARWWPVVLIAVLVLAALAILAYFLRRNSHKERETVAPEYETVVPLNSEQEYVAPVVTTETGSVSHVTDAFGAPEQWQIDDLADNDRGE